MQNFILDEEQFIKSDGRKYKDFCFRVKTEERVEVKYENERGAVPMDFHSFLYSTKMF